MKRIAIFASGSGTNAENLIKYFSTSDRARVVIVLSNNPQAGVIRRAHRLTVPVLVFGRKQLYDTDFVLQTLKDNNVDFIVLAGFLWLVPDSIIEVYRRRIVNIHPALLPDFGGKGMYGDRVHRAVLESGRRQSGITIHYVNERYDEGDIIFQATCPVLPGDSVETLAQRVHELEYEHYPRIVEQLIEIFNQKHKKL